MKGRLKSFFIKRVDIDVEENVGLKATEEIKLLNVFCTVFIVWIAFGVAMFSYDDRGTFGDMFGSINTLFSGFAFGGIIYTIYQQRAEFRLQREELRLQREEVARANEALQEQVKVTNVQRFESTFFNMIDLHNNLVKELVVSEEDLKLWVITKDHDKIYTGKEAFSYLYNQFKDQEVRMRKLTEEERVDAAQFYAIRSEAMGETYLSFFKDAEKKIQPYYKNLLNMISIIHENNWIEDEEKKYYLRILESQLSPDELLMLFYKNMTKKGGEMRSLTKRYSLLKDIRGEDLIYEEDLIIYNNAE
ncbi:putative phage abortive infection protein [Saccharibacillus brassicae]|uniref:Phage abortive infection protein n=1 Tax=Saccharibacillus brassicae TaxID=2583377 RepID=A0A4Y6V4N7_SACBS|nr:putative phage abortive infection protein [Saccharibacillus brassicae]QDH23467.1 hypothetical protein FFV09_22940 [Saccharibacillus brassicae]